MKLKQMSKKLVAIGLSACMLLGGGLTEVGSYIGATTTVNAASTSSSVFDYNDNYDGTITVIGYNGSKTEVVIPSKIDGQIVTGIGYDIYSYYNSWKRPTSVTIPDSVTSIGRSAFFGCTELKSVKIGNSVTSIGEGAFFGCTGLTSITIPDSVAEIGESAFENCDGLTSVTIPNGVISIGEQAFYDCDKLTDVIIGKRVAFMDGDVFFKCPSLKNITVDKNNQHFSSSNGVLFDKNKTALLIYPTTKTGAYTIPDGVTSIYSYAFENCRGLTSVTIPNSVKEIGSWAFADCTGLKKITIPYGVTEIGDSAFVNCPDITNVAIPDSVTYIGEYAFGYYSSYDDYYREYNYTAVPDFIIYGVKESAAESYADENNMLFVETLFNKSTISSKSINLGDTVTLKADAVGSKKPYQYEFTIKHSTATEWTVLKPYNTTAERTWTPSKTGTYQICSKAKSANGIEVEKFFTLTVKEAPLVNTSKISKSTLYNGESVTITGAATGGTKSYKYAFYVKPYSSENWTRIQPYSTTAKKTWKPNKPGKYDILVNVYDGKTTVKKYFTLNALAPLANTSKISKSTIYKGESITITDSATGGKTPYKYAFYLKSSSAKNWTKIQSYSTNSKKTWKPDKTGKYYVLVNVYDGKKTVSKTLMLNVLAPLVNTSKISRTTIYKGNSITITGSATGGAKPYKYEFYVKSSSAKSWTKIKSYSTTATKTWKPNKTGKHQICVYVKDANSKSVKKTFTITVK